MSIHLRVLKNSGAGVFNKLATAGLRLLQVPMLLAALGVEDFGRWLVLSSIPAWLMLANLGFGSVGANEITMAIAANDQPLAKSMFSTTLAFVYILSIVGTILVAVIAPTIPWEAFLSASHDRHKELSSAIIWLAIAVFISFPIEAFGGRFRAAQKTHVAVLISSISPWINFLFLIISLRISNRLDYLALSLLFSNVISYIINWWVSRRLMPDLVLSVKSIEKKRFKYLFQKGVAFQAFPFGAALLFQGNIFIVQSLIGPVGVVVFGTARTLVRTINQFMELINQSIWPEITFLFGAKDFKAIVRIHRTAVMASFSVSVIASILLSIFGLSLYNLWIRESATIPKHLFLIFLLQIPFTAVWFTSSVIHVAGNKHEGLAIRSIFAACLATITCAILSYFFGLEGAAASTIVFDCLMIPYVLRKSLSMTHDNLRDFLNSFSQTLKNSIQYLTRIFKNYLKPAE